MAGSWPRAPAVDGENNCCRAQHHHRVWLRHGTAYERAATGSHAEIRPPSVKVRHTNGATVGSIEERALRCSQVIAPDGVVGGVHRAVVVVVTGQAGNDRQGDIIPIAAGVGDLELVAGDREHRALIAPRELAGARPANVKHQQQVVKCRPVTINQMYGQRARQKCRSYCRKRDVSFPRASMSRRAANCDAMQRTSKTL